MLTDKRTKVELLQRETELVRWNEEHAQAVHKLRSEIYALRESLDATRKELASAITVIENRNQAIKALDVAIESHRAVHHSDYIKSEQEKSDYIKSEQEKIHVPDGFKLQRVDGVYDQHEPIDSKFLGYLQKMVVKALNEVPF